MFWGVVAGLPLFLLAVWWIRAMLLRSRFKHSETGKTIPGSNWPPAVEFLLFGYGNRFMSPPWGDIDLSFAMGFPAVTISDPKLFKEVMSGQGVKEFNKGEVILKTLAPIAGRQNLFSSDGATWVHQRAIISPAFRPKFVSTLMGLIVRATVENIAEWTAHGEKEVGDLGSKMDHLALSIFCRAAFGGVGATSVIKDYNHLSQAIYWSIHGLNPFGKDKIARISQSIDQAAKDLLATCRAKAGSNEAANAPVCLMSLLLAAGENKQPGEGEDVEQESEPVAVAGTSRALTERELIDNIRVMLFAGHETTSVTICSLLSLFAHHPHYQIQAREEVHGFLKVKTMAGIQPDSWSDLPFLESALKESMRLYPTAYINMREAKEDTSLGGYFIPKGTTLILNSLRLQRRADVGWDRPDEFIPERWNTREACHKKGAYCFVPFGGGPRACVGQNLAEAELLVVLCEILSKFEAIHVGKGKTEKPGIGFRNGSSMVPSNLQDLRLRPLSS